MTPAQAVFLGLIGGFFAGRQVAMWSTAARRNKAIAEAIFSRLRDEAKTAREQEHTAKIASSTSEAKDARD